MKDFFIKTFQKKRAIKMILINRDKRQLTKYFVPDEDGNFTWGQQTYKIDQEPYYDPKGFPTYIFKYNNTGPINANPNINNIEKTYMTPSEYNTAIHNRMAQQLFNANDTGEDAGKISMFVSIGTLVVVIAAAYLIYQEISNVLEILRTVEGG